MIQIAPTVTEETPEGYKRQMYRLAQFAHRVHIDIADGVLAPTKLTGVDQIWWPDTMEADVHVMYQRPFDHAEALCKMRPARIIVHAEAEGDFLAFANYAHRFGIGVGVALLPKTPVRAIAQAIEHIDHVLIFAGHLGYQGGKADMGMLKKVPQLRELKPSLEISWDGGVNNRNAHTLIQGGITVLNVGGFIGKAINPAAAYVTLQAIADSYNRGEHVGGDRRKHKKRR